MVAIAREDNLAFMAASVAYYAVASIIPLLTVALVVLSVFGATDVLIGALESSLSSSGQQVVERLLSSTQGRSAAGGAGLLLALWSGIKVFRGTSIAFDQIYDVHSEDSFVDHVWKSLLVLGLLFGAAVLLGTVAVTLSVVRFQIPYPTLLGNAIALVVLCLAFLPIYYVMPPVSVTVRHALPGTVVAAIGWVVLQVAFFYYAGSAGSYAAYGILGAVLLFITFLYLAGIVLLVGAVVNVVLARGPTVTRSPALLSSSDVLPGDQ